MLLLDIEDCQRWENSDRAVSTTETNFFDIIDRQVQVPVSSVIPPPSL